MLKSMESSGKENDSNVITTITQITSQIKQTCSYTEGKIWSNAKAKHIADEVLKVYKWEGEVYGNGLIDCPTCGIIVLVAELKSQVSIQKSSITVTTYCGNCITDAN